MLRMAVIVACLGGCMWPGVEGELVISGTAQDGQVIKPDACADDLDNRQLAFNGVDLFDGPRKVRVAEDAIAGWLIAVTLRDDATAPMTIVEPATCARWDVDLVHAGGKHPSMSGHADIDCPWPDGGRVRGRLEFAGC